tara:strand:+ start:7297 stop:7563 length:267 start_codon:yes stop_codon:yes gene_type:complete
MQGNKQQRKKTDAQRASQLDLARRDLLRALVMLEAASSTFLVDPGASKGGMLDACLAARATIQKHKRAIPERDKFRRELAELQTSPQA